MSEFTADRAGLLACQDISTVVGVMVKWAGLPRTYYDHLNRDEFIAQSREFADLDYDRLNKATKFLSVMNRTHPWTVMRCAELTKWIDEGGYQAVLDRSTRGRSGTIQRDNTVLCRLCRYRLEGGETFCPNCGARLAEKGGSANQSVDHYGSPAADGG